MLALGLSLVNYILRFIRWQHYLAILGHKLPVLPHLRIYIASIRLDNDTWEGWRSPAQHFPERL